MRELRNHKIEGPNGRPILLDVILPEKKDKSVPILIFCHGYKGFKDWGAWNQMSASLARNGLCLVKFNFSFNGGTEDQPIDFPDLEAFANNNYTKELEDLSRVLDWISEDEVFSSPVDRENITLMGHSRGGGIAAIAASEDSRIKRLITLAAVSDFESRFDINSEAFKKWKENGVKYVLNGRTKQNMPHYFQFYEDFIENRDRLNIKTALEKLDKPYLIIHGTADTSVTVQAAYDMAKWNPKAQSKIIDGANHVFGSSHPWNKNELPVELEKVVDYSVNFINRS